MTPQESLKEHAIEVLRSCYDPEIPVNIYDLGLVYSVDADEKGVVSIAMTLTSPNCPVAVVLPMEIRQRVSAIPGVTAAFVNVVWDPPWSPDRMSEAAKLQLNLF